MLRRFSPSSLPGAATLGAYSLQAVIVTICLYVGLEIGNRDLSVPFIFESDALHHALVTKAIVRTGWWFSLPECSAPHGLNMLLFPVGGNVDYGLVWILARFSDDVGLLINVFWLLTFYLSAWSATWCAGTLGLSRTTSWVIGVLFAFLPHTIYRNVVHLMLVTYLVPFVLTGAILVLSGQWSRVPSSRRRLILVGCILIGANYVYTAFFACFVLAVAALGRMLARPAVREVSPALGMLALIAVVAGVSIWPTVTAWRHDGLAREGVTGAKSAAEADIYGLKIRHLLTPIAEHRLAFLRSVARRTSAAGFPLENENATERLGTLGSVGLLGLLLLVTFRLVVPESRVEWLGRPVLAAGSLTMSLILLTTIGGFGSLFNLFASPAIRSYNRAGVFVGFLSLFALASAAESLVRRILPERRVRLALICLAPVIAIGAVLDQAPFAVLEAQRVPTVRKFDTLREFVSRIEASVEEGASVYQLPHSPYPHAPTIASMTAHEHLAAPVISDKLRWSWPPLSGRSQLFSRGMQFLDPKGLVRRLAVLDFAGIWVDGAGYDDGGKGIVAALAAASKGGTPLISRGGRYHFVPLARARTALLAELGADEIERLRWRWTWEVDWEISAVAPQMNTRVGIRNTNAETVSSTGTAGTLIFGPYVPLTPGRYEIRWQGHVYSVSGEIHGNVDVATDIGRRIVARAPMQLTAQKGINAEMELGRIVFSLEESAMDVEFRMRVREGVHLAVTRVLVRELNPNTDPRKRSPFTA